MVKCILIVLVAFGPLVATSQFDRMGIATPWCKGTITLLDGTKLIGLIQNNEKFQQIRFKNKDEDLEDEKLISSENIQTMEYIDSQSSSIRRFASINYKTPAPKESLESKMQSMRFYNSDELVEGSGLFEIIEEFKQFVVLSQISGVDVATRTVPSNLTYANGRWVRTPSQDVSRKVGFEQFEMYFIFNEEGRLDLVLSLNHLEKDKENFLAKKDRTFLDKKAMNTQMNNHWREVENYIKKNDLNLKLKEDFIQILKYYKELEKGDN